jgi:hypothetical protein
MAKDRRNECRTGYTFDIDFDELRQPKRIKVEGEPHEQDAINAHLKTVLEAAPAHSIDAGLAAIGMAAAL